MTPSEAIAECQRCAGTQFGPDVVAILTRPGFERVLRMVANEQATRDRNDVRVAGSGGSVFALQCECGTRSCATMIQVPRTCTAPSARSTGATSSPPATRSPTSSRRSSTPGYAIVEKH